MKEKQQFGNMGLYYATDPLFLNSKEKTQYTAKSVFRLEKIYANHSPDK